MSSILEEYGDLMLMIVIATGIIAGLDAIYQVILMM